MQRELLFIAAARRHDKPAQCANIPTFLFRRRVLLSFMQKEGKSFTSFFLIMRFVSFFKREPHYKLGNNLNPDVYVLTDRQTC